jgi:hypothetical protein
MEMQCVFCAVGTETLNIIYMSKKRLERVKMVGHIAAENP